MTLSRFLSSSELGDVGFGRIGQDVLVDRNAIFIKPEMIELGDSCRIDAFSLITCGAAKIIIGRNVHVGAGTYIYGRGGVELGDYSCLSARVLLFTTSDDYSGDYMTNPTIPEEFTNIDIRPVKVERHALVGAGSILLPGICIGEGAAVGAMSVVKSSIDPHTIYAGNPLRFVGPRNKGMYKLQARMDLK